MSVRADAETFRGIPIFADCDPLHLQLLAFSSVRQSFEPGSLVLKEGMRGGAAFLILSGRADLFAADDKVGSAGPGALLGEVAMIGDTAYAVTARASEAVTSARIDRALFLRVASEYPEFGSAVFHALAAKLGGAMGELAQVQDLFARAKTFKSLR